MSMRIKLKDRTLLNPDFESPEVAYGELSEALCPDIRKRIVVQFNYGGEVLDLLDKYNGCTDYDMMAAMVKELKELYRAYAYDWYVIKKTGAEAEDE